MEQKEIIEGNRLINAFMGYPHNFNEYPEQIVYHSSWDWLMPVVGKIHEITPKIEKPISLGNIKNWSHDNEYLEVTALPLCTPISEAWQAVVKFIQWYNKQGG